MTTETIRPTNPYRYVSEREAVWMAAADAADFMHQTGHPNAPESIVGYADSVADRYAKHAGMPVPQSRAAHGLGYQISETGLWPPKRMALYEVSCTCGFQATVLGRDTRVVIDAHDAHTGHASGNC